MLPGEVEDEHLYSGVEIRLDKMKRQIRFAASSDANECRVMSDCVGDVDVNRKRRVWNMADEASSSRRYIGDPLATAYDYQLPSR